MSNKKKDKKNKSGLKLVFNVEGEPTEIAEKTNYPLSFEEFISNKTKNSKKINLNDDLSWFS